MYKVWVGAALQTSSCGLVALEMKTMAELSPAATITGLVYLLCICGLISGARHPCAMLEMSEGMLYLLCSSSTSCLSLVLHRAPRGRGLCLPHQVPSAAGVVEEGKIPRYPRMSGYCPRAQGGVEMLFLLQYFRYLSTQLSPNLRSAARMQNICASV